MLGHKHQASSCTKETYWLILSLYIGIKTYNELNQIELTNPSDYTWC